MKQLNFTILFAVLMSMVGAKAFAYDFAVKNKDDVTIYYLKTSNTEVAVTHTIFFDTEEDNSNTYTGNVVIPSSVTYNEITYSVTSIGDKAFIYCSGLTSVTIPNSVTSISDEAFAYCSGLTSVTIPNSVISIGKYAFEGTAWYNNQPDGVVYVGKILYKYKGTMSANTKIVINEGTLTISGVAFEGCTGLTSIEIPNSVTFIGEYAFSSCTGLTSIEIPNSVNSIGEYAFTDCTGLPSIIIPNSVSSIGGGVFYECTGLTSATIGNSVTSIGIQMFYGCTGLTSIEIPNSVTSIGNDAFRNCSGLTSVTIGNSVTRIDEGAFWECGSLSQVTSKISTPFDVNAFDSNIVTLVVPKDSRSDYKKVKGWSYFAFIYEEGEIMYDMEQTDEQGVCYSLRQADDDGFYYAVTGHTDDLKSEIVIPADIDGCPVKTIDDLGIGAFKGCSNLTSVKIGKNVRSIGDHAFFECASLSSVTLSQNLESIGDFAFACELESNYCPITSIAIPHSVKTIGNDAFSCCRNLTLVSFEVDKDGNTCLTSIGSEAFSWCSLISITIPNSVTKIENWAFAHNKKLTTAILGKGITKIVCNTFEGCGNLVSVTIPDGVTSIQNYAFMGCQSLTSIKLPKSLTTMGEYVFSGCPLKSIELPNAFTAIPDNLFNDNDLKYIKLGNNVKSIGKNAFGSTGPVIEIGTSTPPTIANDAFPNVEYLADVNVIVPDAAAETAYRKAAVWKEMTFTNQNNVSEVTVDTPGELDYELITDCNMQPAKVVSLKVKGTINAKDFNQMRTNMKSLLRLDLSDCDITEIPEGALKGKTQLQDLILPTKLKTIGNYAFNGCTYLMGKLNLPSGVTSIGDYAFEGTYYTSVALPKKLQTIGSYAFSNLPIKQKIILPDALISIGDYAFAETQISGHAEFPDGIKYLGAGAFRNTQINPVSLPDNPNGITSISRELFQGCSSFDYIYIPENITEVSGYAFDGCSELKYVRMSPNLETLGEYAFQNTQLEYLKVPSKVEILSEGVLRDCKSLESLSLPANLKLIESEALMGCSALHNLSIEAIEPPTIDKSSIRGINTDLCVISIPTQSYKAYVLAEYWGQFVQMRNDIAVETEGNGEIAFESVEEGEEETAGSRRRAQSVTEEESMTIANNGSSLYVPQNGKVRFIIIPGEGEKLLSATLDGEDIMPYIVNGVYTATADKKNAKLVVKFSDTEQSVVTVTSCSRKYGEANPTFKYTVTGGALVGTPEITCEATKTSPVGEYTINIAKGSITNKNVTLNGGTLTIEKAPLKITAKDYTIKQGEALPTFEATYEGFKNDETESVLTKKPTFTTTATSESDPDVYDIIVSAAEAQNYEISYAKGHLTITEADGILGISVEHPADVYDLQGNKVGSKMTTLKDLSKGVYIINGKKVLVR